MSQKDMPSDAASRLGAIASIDLLSLFHIKTIVVLIIYFLWLFFNPIPEWRVS